MIDEEIRNYITGHTTANAAANYGKYPIPMLANEVEKVDPLTDTEAMRLAA